MAELSVVGLRVVREVARQGSLTAAAERLGYTQSAVSRQVALMERAAGQALFERHARGVRLTEAGGIVVRHAGTVLAELEATSQDLEDLGVLPHGRVRLGAFSTALCALVPRAVAAYSAREARTEVVIREGTSPSLMARTADGRLDLAVVTPSPEVPAGLDLTVLLEDPLLIAVSRDHPLAGRASVPADALRDERWISASAQARSTLLGAWTGSDWQPDIAYVARDWTAKLGLAAACLGITVVPGLAVPMLPPTLAVVRIDHPAAVRTTAMVAQAGAPPDPHRHAVSEALRDTAADIAAEVRLHLTA
ncbi:MAG TPA: LysR family transcriptional regulator [Thermoleophilaceae bacterium]|jgi:DNA-binding transcriptional LysR family regulator